MRVIHLVGPVEAAGTKTGRRTVSARLRSRLVEKRRLLRREIALTRLEEPVQHELSPGLELHGFSRVIRPDSAGIRHCSAASA